MWCDLPRRWRVRTTWSWRTEERRGGRRPAGWRAGRPRPGGAPPAVCPGWQSPGTCHTRSPRWSERTWRRQHTGRPSPSGTWGAPSAGSRTCLTRPPMWEGWRERSWCPISRGWIWKCSSLSSSLCCYNKDYHLIYVCNCTPEESSDHAEVTREGDDDEDGVETDQDGVGGLRHGLAAQVTVIFWGLFLIYGKRSWQYLLFTIEVENHHFYFLTVVSISDIPQSFIFLKEYMYMLCLYFVLVLLFCCWLSIIDSNEPDYWLPQLTY